MINKKLTYKQGLITKNINEELKKDQIVYIVSESDTHANVFIGNTSKKYKILKSSVLIF